MIKDEKWYKALLSYIILAIGVLIMAMSLEYFLGPNTIAPGGVTGLSVVINKLSGIPIYITNLAINVPLFILGVKTLGKSTAIKTIYSTILLSLFLRFLPSSVLTHDILLSAIFGGVLMGLGLGIVFKIGGTTGGTDLAGSILNSKFPSLSTVTFMTIIDLLVVVFTGLVDKKIETSLYSMIAMFVVMKVVDTILEGMAYLKGFIIITNKPDEVSERLMEELERGVTSLKGKGMYTKEDKEILLCVVNRVQFSRVKKIVKEVDPNAFIMVSEMYEVLGEGFEEI